METTNKDDTSTVEENFPEKITFTDGLEQKKGGETPCNQLDKIDEIQTEIESTKVISDVTPVNDTSENMDDTATIDTNSDTIEASPIPSIKSLGSGDFEEPLTPFTDGSSKSETSRSQAGGSGRVTPASQSDQSISLSSSEKSTPNKKRKSMDASGGQIDFETQHSKIPTTVMTRAVKFPFRVGIQWKKGEKLEAMDFMHKWFPAKIKEIDSESLSVLIHFDGWNQRFDEWVDMASDRIRPLIRHSERKDKGKRLKGDYKIGEQVYAKWTDCKMYPAKITAISPNGAYEVIFYDGFKKQVQPINLRPMPGEFKKKTFEINPVSAEVIKKTKIRKELIGVATPDALSDAEKHKSGERRRSSERNSCEKTSKSKSNKIKMIPADLFKQSRLDRDDSEVIGSELAGTHGAYLDKVDLQGELETTQSMQFYPETDPQMSLDTPGSSIPSTSYGQPLLPPKAFVVESDHNQYKCQYEGCNKGFRKEHLLEYHMKYYHIDGAAAPPPPQPSRKRRKTAGSTDSETASSSGKKSVQKQRRHLSLESGLQKEIQVEIKDEVVSPVSTYAPETGEISTQTTPVKGSEQDSTDDTYPPIKDEFGSKHQRTQSQDSNWTEDSSVTDVEGEDSLKPDELVNCICDYYEENGLMIQCEVCMCWQHAGCFGITERTLPKTYVCFVCENPPGVRESAKHIHEQDWLKNGEVPHFNYLQSAPVSEERRNIIKATNSLVTDVHQLNTVLYSLKLQLQILKTKDEQKLKMWRMDWDLMDQFDESADHLNEDQEREQADKDQNDVDENILSNNNQTNVKQEKNGMEDNGMKEEEVGGVGSEIESNGERKNGVDTGGEMEDSGGRKNNEINENLPTLSEHRHVNNIEQNANASEQGSYDNDEVMIDGERKEEIKSDGDRGPLAGNTTGVGAHRPDHVENPGTSYLGTNSHEHSKEKTSFEVEMEEANHSDSTESAVEDPLEMCEKNLLNHILRVQDEISSRMDQIEEQVALLEAVEAAQYNKEPPPSQNILSDMPQLKRCMKLMHGDLNKVKKMAVFH